jgi:hypothetical protein
MLWVVIICSSNIIYARKFLVDVSVQFLACQSINVSVVMYLPNKGFNCVGKVWINRNKKCKFSQQNFLNVNISVLFIAVTF